MEVDSVDSIAELKDVSELAILRLDQQPSRQCDKVPAYRPVSEIVLIRVIETFKNTFLMPYVV